TKRLRRLYPISTPKDDTSLGVLTPHHQPPWSGVESMSPMYSREQENSRVFPQPARRLNVAEWEAGYVPGQNAVNAGCCSSMAFEERLHY
ncbi:MAG TPA: hypothetical protein PKD12_21040, partial [Nitrospira sp.]|nr:hypothetical protein [Nitrospira sp.]